MPNALYQMCRLYQLANRMGNALWVFLPLAIAATALAPPAAAQGAVGCSEVTYGSSSYNEAMDELADQAELPDAAWNRNHETLVSALCKGDTKTVDEIVENKVIPADDAMRIAEVLGVPYGPKPVADGEAPSYKDTKAKLIQMGMCNACADNVAQWYTRIPHSECAMLAHRALAKGDSRAVDELVTFPEFCAWTYE
jgi:hypothetical protein